MQRRLAEGRSGPTGLGPLVLLTLLGACAAAPPEVEESAVRHAIAAWDSAWARKDSAAAGRWMAPEYSYFSSRGRVIPRKELLGWLEQPGYRLQDAERGEMGVALHGATAVVSSRWRGRGQWNGVEFVDDQRCSLVAVRDGAGWRLMSEHCTQIVDGNGG